MRQSLKQIAQEVGGVLKQGVQVARDIADSEGAEPLARALARGHKEISQYLPAFNNAPQIVEDPGVMPHTGSEYGHEQAHGHEAGIGPRLPPETSEPQREHEIER